MADFSHPLAQAVGRAFFGSFKDLRPIQRDAIPFVLAGSDVMVRSATASGKTEAALAPLVARYLYPAPRCGVAVLFVTPTKALVNDLVRRLEGPLEALGLTVGVRHGERDQLNRRAAPHVLVTTPESFDVEVGRRNVALASVKAVVLDEAHLLYNTQRGMQVGITLRRLERIVGHHVQVVGLSATCGDAADAWAFFRPGHEVVEVAAPGGRAVAAQLRLDVSHAELAGLLANVPDAKVLVFVTSRRECDALSEALWKAGVARGNVFAHHSSLSGAEREVVEESFQQLPAAVCVATSTLELGIDIGSIDLVVVYGMPTSWQSLAQRLGRGNRRAECVEVLLCTPARRGAPGDLEDQLAPLGLLAQLEDPSLTDEAPHEVYGAVAQQIASELEADGGFVGFNTILRDLEPWTHLDESTVRSLLDHLVEEGVLVRHPVHNRFGPGDGAHELRERGEIWSNFSGRGREAPVRAPNGEVGRISQRDAARLAAGDCFVLGGRRWLVRHASPFGAQVDLTKQQPNVQLRHEGRAPTSNPMLAESIRRAIHLPVDHWCDVRPAGPRDLVTRVIEELRPLASEDVIGHFQDERGHHYLTFAGARLNQSIASAAGCAKSEAGELLLTADREIPWTEVLTLVDDVSWSRHDEESRFQQLLPAELRHRERRSSESSMAGMHVVIRRLRGARPIEFEPSVRLLTLLVGGSAMPAA